MSATPTPSPDDLTTHLHLGIAYAEMGLQDTAAAELELHHDPENATLAFAKAKQGTPPDSGPIGAA